MSANIAINYYGHVGSPTGYGRAANDLCLALLRAGVRLHIYALGHDRLPANPVLEGIYAPLKACLPGPERGPENHHPDIVIVHTLPVDCGTLIETVAPRYVQFGANPRYIAYTTWEALTVPVAVARALGNFDQVWVPSGWNQRAFVGSENWPLGVSTYVVPHGIAEEEIPRRRELGAGAADPDGRFRFYWSGAFTARKNAAGLLRAFVHAFDASDNVSLTIHSAGLQASVVAEVLGRCGVGQDTLPKMKFNNRLMTDDEMWALPAAHDCYVSATNGEAWNYSAFDAVIAERPVIVPVGQGSDAFVNHVWHVDGLRRPAQVDVIVQSMQSEGDSTTANAVTVAAQGLTARDQWAETDLSQLAHALRFIADKGARTRIHHDDLADRFGLTTIGRIALEHLERIP